MEKLTAVEVEYLKGVFRREQINALVIMTLKAKDIAKYVTLAVSCLPIIWKKRVRR